MSDISLSPKRKLCPPEPHFFDRKIEKERKEEAQRAALTQGAGDFYFLVIVSIIIISSDKDDTAQWSLSFLLLEFVLSKCTILFVQLEVWDEIDNGKYQNIKRASKITNRIAKARILASIIDLSLTLILATSIVRISVILSFQLLDAIMSFWYTKKITKPLNKFVTEFRDEILLTMQYMDPDELNEDGDIEMIVEL